MPTDRDRTIVMIDRVLWIAVLILMALACMKVIFPLAVALALALNFGTSSYLLYRMVKISRQAGRRMW